MFAAIAWLSRFLGVVAGMFNKLVSRKMELERFRNWRKADAVEKLKKAIRARRAAGRRGDAIDSMPDDGFRRED